MSRAARVAALLATAGLGCTSAPPPPLPPSAARPSADRTTALAVDARDAGLGAGAEDAPPPLSFRRCRRDEDCVVVARVGCCHNGWKEAVAASQRDAYERSFVCSEAHPLCAMYVVLDHRVAHCGAEQACVLVAGDGGWP